MQMQWVQVDGDLSSNLDHPEEGAVKQKSDKLCVISFGVVLNRHLEHGQTYSLRHVLKLNESKPNMMQPKVNKHTSLVSFNIIINSLNLTKRGKDTPYEAGNYKCLCDPTSRQTADFYLI